MPPALLLVASETGLLHCPSLWGNPALRDDTLIDTVGIVERNDLTASASSRSYGRLRLRLDENIPALPGQFAMIKPRRVIEPLLRRAMAYYQCERNGGGLSVEFIYQIL